MAADAIERAREAAGRSAWPEAYRLLREQPLDDLTATDLESLADAAWWLSKVEESLAARRRAHAAYAADAWSRRAGYNAWMLATEYDLIGKPALAAGWLTKARRHLEDQPECVEQGYLAFAEAQMASATGDGQTARRLADHVIEVGTSCASPEVISMGRLLRGEALIATGDPATGLAHLDETMCDVMAGGLDDLTPGWLYCLAVQLCLRLSELERDGVERGLPRVVRGAAHGDDTVPRAVPGSPRRAARPQWRLAGSRPGSVTCLRGAAGLPPAHGSGGLLRPR